eukprot:1176563-Prorocentrum_minimum.AAC.2
MGRRRAREGWRRARMRNSARGDLVQKFPAHPIKDFFTFSLLIFFSPPLPSPQQGGITFLDSGEREGRPWVRYPGRPWGERRPRQRQGRKIQPARRQGRAQFGWPLGGRCDTGTHSNGALHKK